MTNEPTRSHTIHRLLDTAWQNLRYAARVLMRSPGFTAVAVLSIAIGIGANTAIFSLLNALLLKTLPVRNPEELVFVKYQQLEGRAAGIKFTGFAYPNYADLRDRSAASAELFAFGGAGIDLAWSGEVAGVVVGAWGAGQLGRLFKGLLFGVNPWDARTLAGAAAVLVVTALAATCLPARRAPRIETVCALRYE